MFKMFSLLAILALVYMSVSLGERREAKRINRILIDQRNQLEDSATALHRNSDTVLTAGNYTLWEYKNNQFQKEALRIAEISTAIQQED